jgi:hypothetical protein
VAILLLYTEAIAAHIGYYSKRLIGHLMAVDGLSRSDLGPFREEISNEEQRGQNFKSLSDLSFQTFPSLDPGRLKTFPQNKGTLCFHVSADPLQARSRQGA